MHAPFLLRRGSIIAGESGRLIGEGEDKVAVRLLAIRALPSDVTLFLKPVQR
jgi:hypothetical protein